MTEEDLAKTITLIFAGSGGLGALALFGMKLFRTYSTVSRETTNDSANSDLVRMLTDQNRLMSQQLIDLRTDFHNQLEFLEKRVAKLQDTVHELATYENEVLALRARVVELETELDLKNRILLLRLTPSPEVGPQP